MAEQVPLWHDSIEDAIGTAVQALGGAKVVAAHLWPVLARSKPETAYTRLRHSLNPEKPEKLSPDELVTVARLAVEIGEHSIGKYLARELGYELKTLPPGDAKKRAKRARRLALLEELQRLEDE